MGSLFTTITSEQTVVNSGICIEQEVPLNSDPNNTPWVGVYFEDALIEPYRSNITSPWMVQYNLLLYIQGSSYDDPTEANDLLHKTMDVVLSAVNSNRTLDQTVLHIKEWNIEPVQRDLEEDGYFFTNEIRIQAEGYA